MPRMPLQLVDRYHNIPTRLQFLDGVRAVSALYVFCVHVFNIHFRHTETNHLVLGLFAFSSEAVTTFIVLSGCCLGLRMHQSRSAKQYLIRRSRRILPSYYAAICLLCVLLWVKRSIEGVTGIFAFAPLLPDLLLCKEFFWSDPGWLPGSAAFWTVGIEYRLYWLLPAMAICFKRFGFWGLWLCAAYAYLFASLILYVLHLHNGSLWFIFAFTMGVTASQLVTRLNVPKSVTLLIAFIVAAVKVADGLYPNEVQTAIADTLWGLLIAVLLLIGMQATIQNRFNRALRWLSSPLLAWVATWSYSLYLLHYGLLYYSNWLLSGVHIRGWSAIAIETPIILCGCWLFSLVFERPFTNSHKPF